MSGHPVTDRTIYRRRTAVILCLVLGLLPFAGSGVIASSSGSGDNMFALAAPAAAIAGTGNSTGPTRTLVSRLYPSLPLSFEPNRGQAGPRARYVARGRGYTLALTDTGAALNLAAPPARSCAGMPATALPAREAARWQRTLSAVGVSWRRSARPLPCDRNRRPHPTISRRARTHLARIRYTDPVGDSRSDVDDALTGVE